MTPVTFTGCPESFVGENLAPRAAPTATACSNGWPDTARAEITLPFSSMVTWTTTVPEACACLAIGGYAGFGRLIAFPFKTPPEIGALGGVGLAGGGGGSAMSTLVGAETIPVPVPGPAAIGAAAFEIAAAKLRGDAAPHGRNVAGLGRDLLGNQLRSRDVRNQLSSDVYVLFYLLSAWLRPVSPADSAVAAPVPAQPASSGRDSGSPGARHTSRYRRRKMRCPARHRRRQ